MKFMHHALQIELNDKSWHEAGMVGFVPSSDAYRASPDRFNREIHMIRVNDVGAVNRSPGVGIVKSLPTVTDVVGLSVAAASQFGTAASTPNCRKTPMPSGERPQRTSNA